MEVQIERGKPVQFVCFLILGEVQVISKERYFVLQASLNLIKFKLIHSVYVKKRFGYCFGFETFVKLEL